MPSNRRVKVVALAVVITVILVMFYSGDARQRNDDFYQRTVAAMDAAQADSSRESDTQSLLKNAQEVASKSKLNGGKDSKAEGSRLSSAPETEVSPEAKLPVEFGKGRQYQHDDSASENGVAGGKLSKIDKSGGSEQVIGGSKDSGASEKSSGKPKDAEAETELNAILKRSPIIIFSKSYCPYSRRAKALLLDTYSITPAPYVVELDLLTTENKESTGTPQKFPHPDDAPEDLALGQRLQNLLADNTGRKTVPNIMINGKSIGGSDDIAAMDQKGELVDKIKSLGGKRITKVEKSEAST